MEVTLRMLLIVCPLAFLAALVDSIAGGGGLISLPAYLLAGLPAQMASGTNKFSACCACSMATFRFGKNGKILWKPALIATLGAFPGSYMGAWVQQQLPENYIRGFMLIAIPCIAVLLLFQKNTLTEPRPVTNKTYIFCFLIGLGVGFYDGFFGPGTGTLLIMFFTWITGMDMVSASGCAKVVNLSSNIAALVSFFIGRCVLLPLALPATCCSMLGAFVGSGLALKRGAKFIRYVMLCVLAGLIIKLAIEFFQ